MRCRKKEGDCQVFPGSTVFPSVIHDAALREGLSTTRMAAIKSAEHQMKSYLTKFDHLCFATPLDNKPREKKN